MKKIVLLSLGLISSLQTSDYHFSSFMWGVTTSVLIGSFIRYNNYIKSTPPTTGNPIETSATSTINSSWIIEKKAKFVTQDCSALLTPYIKGILTLGDVDVRVLEGSDKNQMTITSNEYFIGNVDIFIDKEILNVKFFNTEKNSSHKPVIHISLKNYLSSYTSRITSRLEVTAAKRAQGVKRLALESHDYSSLLYQSEGADDQSISAFANSTAYVQGWRKWSTYVNSSASLYINEVKQKYSIN